eukprot:GHVR01151085.1.p1 GENE.GHVR01151085.1~~GHVR01151085.1.p1  ORF type:complete len:470 (+),score=101.39 GHVR01151085.1:126-1535(+)
MCVCVNIYVCVCSTRVPLVWGYILVMLMFTTSILKSFILHQYFHRVVKLGIFMKAALTAELFRKSLRIIPGVVLKDSKSSALDLVGVDTQRIQDLMMYLQVIWSAPLTIIFSIWMLFKLVGVSCFAGVGVLVLSMPLGGVLSRRMKGINRMIMSKKDERMKVTHELLYGIRVVKMYAWEAAFLSKITSLRVSELLLVRSYRMRHAINNVLWLGVPVVVSFTTFVAYVLLGNILDVATVFTSVALFQLMRFPLMVFPMMINSLIEATISIKRIEEYLGRDEVKFIENLPTIPIKYSNNDTLIDANNLTLVWPDNSSLLKDVSFKCNKGELTVIIGKTGCGKTGLLTGLVGDAVTVNGTYSIKGKVSYSSQTPWIQHASVKANIVFGAPFDRTWYDTVKDVCQLNQDIALLPCGDETEIGEKGINLSGGQRARVSLARGVYQMSDVFLLDDILSAVDSHVATQIFNKFILF